MPATEDLLLRAEAFLQQQSANEPDPLLAAAEAFLAQPKPEDLLAARFQDINAKLESINDPRFNESDNPEFKLGVYNNYRRRTGLSNVATLPPELTKNTLGQVLKKEFATGEGLVRKIPVAGAAAEGLALFNVYDAARRAEDGKASTKDYEVLAKFQEDMIDAHVGGEGVPAKAAEIFAGSIPFMGEFLLSGGLVAAGKKAIGKGAKEATEAAVKKGVRAAIEKALVSTAKTLTGSVVRTPVFSARIGANTVARMIPDFGIDPEDGSLEYVEVKPGETLEQAAKNAIVDTYIEIVSEQTGKAIGLIGKPLEKIPGVGKLAKGYRSIPASQFLERAGFNGILEEMGEERVGDALRKAVTAMGMADLPADIIPSGEQLASEALAFSVPGAAGAVSGSLSRREMKPVPLAPEVAKFAEENPEQAQAIAEKETPSRADVAKVPGFKESSKEDRQKLAQELRAYTQTIQSGKTTTVSVGEPTADVDTETAAGPAAKPRIYPQSDTTFTSAGQMEQPGPRVDQQPAESPGRPVAAPSVNDLTQQATQVPPSTESAAEGPVATPAAKSVSTARPKPETVARFRTAREGGASIGTLTEHAAKLLREAKEDGAQTDQEIIAGVADSVGDKVVSEMAPVFGAAFQKEFGRPIKQPVRAILGERKKAAVTPKGLKREDLANPALTDAGRQQVEAVDVIRTAAGAPSPQSDAAVNAAAQARLAKDYKGEKANILAKAAVGHGLDPVETIIAKNIIRDMEAQAVNGATVKERLDALEFVDAYRETGAEAGRRLRIRRNEQEPRETPEQFRKRTVNEAIARPPERMANKMRKARKDGDKEALKRLQKKWAEELEDLKKKFLAAGIDLDDAEFMDNLTEEQAIDILRMDAALKENGWDVLYEYWQNSILSAPPTQAANFIGNTANTAWKFIVERLVEAGFNSITGKGVGDVGFSEYADFWKGFFPSLSKAAVNAWKFLKYKPVDTGALALANKLDQRIEPNVGKVRKAIRFPGYHLLQTADLFAKTFIANVEVAVQARMIAKREGLAGEALQVRMHELIDNHQSDAWQEAVRLAEELTFQERGKALDSLLQLRRDIPGSRYIVPFVTTPFNLFRLGIRKSPIGALNLPIKAYRNIRAGKAWKEGMSERVAEQIIAWALLLALFRFDDPDDPWVTGSAEGRDYQQRQQSYRMQRPAMTIRIPGTDMRFSYARIEPFSTVLALAVDLKDGILKGDFNDRVLGSMVGLVGNKTFLSGIADLMRAVDRQDPQSGLLNWAGNFSVSWIPNIVRSTARAVDPVIAERRVWGSTPEKNARIMWRTLAKTEIGGLYLDDPKVDIWGRDIENVSPGWGPQADFLFRAMVPTRLYDQSRVAIGDQVILHWNGQNPEKAVTKNVPRKEYNLPDGSTKYMTDEQWTQYMRLSGQAADLVVQMMNPNAENPTATDLGIVEDALTNARTRAKKALVASWHKGEPVPTPQELAMQIKGDRIVSMLNQYKRENATEEQRQEVREFIQRGGYTYEQIQDLLKAEYKVKTPYTRNRKLTAYGKALRDIRPLFENQ